MFRRRDGGNGTLLTARSVVEGPLLCWLLFVALLFAEEVIVAVAVDSFAPEDAACEADWPLAVVVAAVVEDACAALAEEAWALLVVLDPAVVVVVVEDDDEWLAAWELAPVAEGLFESLFA